MRSIKNKVKYILVKVDLPRLMQSKNNSKFISKINKRIKQLNYKENIIIKNNKVK